ncbi:hypothetical protein [Enterovirga aerilata]|uniref:Uncharacterized protein n=1 Tax=Enterovirga aerilata TaxID=2730920 RepID=A0A849I3A5_9HYPH|nr:hypothetical protein [Enterovirga sp. DB1703]NNM74286.1 hypothetical protein [Enterovirga sp. DB1703]
MAVSTREGAGMDEPEGGTARELEAQAASIRDFDAWFRYAEEIGQDRLGSFLFTVSILLAAFATLYAEGVFAISLVLSLSGVLFSFVWLVIGTRQGKFHDMLECEIDRRLREWIELGGTGGPALFPISHVRGMKVAAARDEATRPEKPGTLRATAAYFRMVVAYLRMVVQDHMRARDPGGMAAPLDHVENVFATRKLLWIVPLCFLGLYLVCSSFALFALVRRAIGAG